MDNQSKILNIINEFVSLNKKATREKIVNRYFELYPVSFEYLNQTKHHNDVIYRSLYGMIKRKLIYYQIERIPAISRAGNKIKSRQRVYYPCEVPYEAVYDQV